MKRTINYHIWPRDLDFATKLPTLFKFLNDRGYIEPKFQHYSVRFDKYEKVNTSKFEDLITLLGTKRSFETLSFNIEFSEQKMNKRLRCELDFRGIGFEIAIDADNDDIGLAMHNLIRQELNLRNPPALKAESGRANNLQATIFLGRHFDNSGNQTGSIVRRFLSLLRFEVSEADEYRAMPIPEKVKHLIEGPDIYIGLVTENREHGWIIAESSYAAALGKHIVLLIEEGSNFNPTLQGHDFEQIRFPKGEVEKSFLNLLSEFHSLGILGL